MENKLRCQQCQNIGHCSKYNKHCPYVLSLINGNSPLKELLKYNLDWAVQEADYKDVLNEYIDARRRHLDKFRLAKIRQISDPLMRALAALIRVGFSITEIVQVAKRIPKSRVHIYRLIKGG